MGLWAQFIEAVLNLFSAKLRSILAILGILVGTGSVVALITTSQLATTHALAQFKSLGTNLLSVSITPTAKAGKGTGARSELSLSNVEQIKRNLPEIQKIAPYITLYQGVVYAGKQYQGAVVGAYHTFAEIAKVYLKRGRFVKQFDRSAPFAVIGSKLADNLKSQGLTDPIGKQIRLGNFYFTVVGVLRPWVQNLFVYMDLSNGVIIPIEAAKLLSNYAQINNLLIRLKPEADLQKTQAKITDELRQFLPVDQINVRNPEEIIGLMEKQQATYAWLLGAIGGISLLVGGIGVMNIMLVSVIERKREIGIRLAIGAHQRNILLMFLIESVMLTLFGGILGIVMGLTVSYVIAKFSGWAYYFYLMPPVLGFAVSVLVGIASGFYPALRASRLDPIESLQSQ